MASQGSTGNVIAAICSFFFPGLGQLVQGRLMGAAFYFIGCAILYCLTWTGVGLIFALILHLMSILSAAMFKS